MKTQLHYIKKTLLLSAISKRHLKQKTKFVAKKSMSLKLCITRQENMPPISHYIHLWSWSSSYPDSSTMSLTTGGCQTRGSALSSVTLFHPFSPPGTTTIRLPVDYHGNYGRTSVSMCVNVSSRVCACVCVCECVASGLMAASCFRLRGWIHSQKHGGPQTTDTTQRSWNR